MATRSTSSSSPDPSSLSEPVTPGASETLARRRRRSRRGWPLPWRRSWRLLSRGTRRVAEGAAVVGDLFEPELARAAADVDRARRRSTAIDELLRLDLVRSTEVPRRFRFRHPLVRRAVYDVDTGRLAARRTRADRRGARGKRGAPAVRARPPCRALRSPGRQGRGCDRCARPARTIAHRAPASAARWFAGAAAAAPATMRRPSARVELLLAHAGTLAVIRRLHWRRIPSCSRASRSYQRTPSASGSSSRRPAPGWSICWAATRMRTPASTPPSRRLSDSRLVPKQSC